MAPKRGGLTDEQKEEAFNAWKAGADYNAIMDL